MRVDVAHAALARVGAQPVPQPVPAARQRAAEHQLVQRRFVAQRQAQQRAQVRRADPASRVGLGKTDVPRAQDALAGAPVVQLERRAGSRMGVAEHHARIAGGDQFQVSVTDIVQ